MNNLALKWNDEFYFMLNKKIVYIVVHCLFLFIKYFED
jgi:hypothetical protein